MVCIDLDGTLFLCPNLYTSDTIYIHSKIYRLVEIILMLKRSKSFRVNILDIRNKKTWDKVINKNQNDILKALVLSFNRKKLKKIQYYIINELNLEAYMSSKFTLEINTKGIDKASGVKKLAKYYKINQNEIICIGDNENDLSMIEYAGLGVAMENAKESIKKKSDFVTSSNNNFGVGSVVYRYILNK